MTQSDGKRLAPLAFGLLVLAGCAAHNPVETFIYDGWTLGFTTAELREHLGPPREVRTVTVENRHVSGQQDEIREVFYSGLRLTFCNLKETPEREMLASISLSSSKYDVRRGLKVGVPKEAVRRKLGDKFERLGQAELRERPSDAAIACDPFDCASVYTHHPDGSQVLFTLADDRVSRIDWFFYLD